jgi:Tfp pilus assembly protein PilF
MMTRRLSASVFALASLAACAQPRFVDKAAGEEPGSLLAYNEVTFQVHEAYTASPPDCVAVLPLTVRTPGEPQARDEDAAKVRLSLYAHLAAQSKRGVRLERVDHVLAAARDDRKALAEGIKCAAVIEGEVTEYGNSFYGLFSNVTAGVSLKMVRPADGALLWEGSHLASSRGGSLPLDPIGLAMAAIDAFGNMRDEQILRVTDDLARRLVSTIPDNKVAATDDPVEPPPLKPAKAPAVVDDVAAAEALLAEGDHAGALAAADRALVANPDRSDAHFLKGRVLMLDKDYAAAEPAIIKAVALDRGNARYLNALGAVNAEKGAVERALAAYRMAIDADPANGFAWYNTGVIQLNAGQPQEAAEAFTGAGMAYLKAGNYAKAERTLSELRELAKAGIPLDREITAIEGALSDLSRRKS